LGRTLERAKRMLLAAAVLYDLDVGESELVLAV
jgi:hypothetical protein